MYYNLKLKKIDFIDQNINMKNIIRELSLCYKNYAFSTFPYIIDGISSKDSILKYKSGNCIGLSMVLKKMLKDKYNIESYLIPASIPKKFSKPGYLEISHVALAIPKNKNQCYIADPAFYFLNPIKYKNNYIETGKSTLSYSKNIYEKENNNKPENYSSIDKILSNSNKLKNDMILNKYQIIPKDTTYVNTYYQNDKVDSWKYYIIEVLNPDKSISEFFINIMNKPFIVTTKLDKNGICCMDIYLKFINEDTLQITYNNKIHIINMKDISKSELEKKLIIFNKKLSNYFNNNMIDMLLKYKKKYNTIND